VTRNLEICACNAGFEEAIWVLEAMYTSGIGRMVKILLQEEPNLMVRFDYEEGAVGGIRRTSRANKQDVALGELLIEHRLKKATDPKDKVCSLLGLVAREKQSRIPVDYGLDTRSLFQKVATFLVTEEEQSLNILGGNRPPRSDTSDLGESVYPLSWVPNWGGLDQADNIRIDRIICWASASGTSISDAFIRDLDILCVKGIRLGTITRLGPMMLDLGNEELIFTPVFDVLYAWWLIFLASGKKDLIGEQGFVNFLFLGDGHRYEKFTRKEMEITETDIVSRLRILLSIYKPDDETIIPFIGKQEEVVDDNTRRTAETDLWGIAPLTRKRKAFLVTGSGCELAPHCAELGDLVVMVMGCKAPLDLRKRAEEEGGGCLTLGDAYVDGFMKGEAVRDLDVVKRRLEVFELH
jgi:hypothetical protein